MGAFALKPVSTRSAVLTLLLGAERSSLTAREVVAAASVVGFAEPAVRMALSRMVSAGDLVRDGVGSYALSERLIARQRRQEEAAHPSLRPWDGTWDLVVVTGTGRSASDRADLRGTLTELRLAELREGVWTRPSNLEVPLPDQVTDVVDTFSSASVRDSGALAGALWDLLAWAETARSLLAATVTDDPVMRFTACATAGRHLLTDPVLPAELLPDDWPGDELRQSHLAYKQWVVEMRLGLLSR